jgi:hypothetical protein
MFAEEKSTPFKEICNGTTFGVSTDGAKHPTLLTVMKLAVDKISPNLHTMPSRSAKNVPRTLTVSPP